MQFLCSVKILICDKIITIGNQGGQEKDIPLTGQMTLTYGNYNKLTKMCGGFLIARHHSLLMCEGFGPAGP
jgi:hypothetical protein